MDDDTINNPIDGSNFRHTPRRQIDAPPIAHRFSLRGKTAIVTGAASGIGLAVAEAMAQMGANVAIWYNSDNAAVE